MHTGRLRFDIGLLAERLVGATDWLAQEPDTTRLPIGYFGASTGAAAALVAAAKRPRSVAAVVSRGGRPDLAGHYLSRVEAPTLLIVGGNDPLVLELNRAAFEELRCEKRLEIVPGATHLFEEPGALDEVARLAREWFEGHFSAAG
jgi:dienelactone hydrolase